MRKHPSPHQQDGLTGKPTVLESWWRTHSATVALLRDACARIEEAEDRIRQLEGLAASDYITGLMNRRGFENFYEREVARLHRYRTQGGLLVLIDLDRFKAINDTHGHAAGDACLKHVGKKLMSCIRATDGAARLGGDEFALFLTQTDPFRAASRVEKIRATLDEISLKWEGETLRLRASMGFEHVTGDADFSAIYTLTDKALYADKGRRK